MSEDLGRLGAAPYNFEPLLADHPEYMPQHDDDSENENDVSAINVNNERVGNTNWCTCGNCKEMPTALESVCCREIPKLVQETPGLHCLDWRKFKLNCLEIDVLEPTYLRYVQETNDRNDHEIHEKYRYIAYRQYIYITFRAMGNRNRTPIPSCAVCKIRETFPSEEYTGFKYPRR